ncbi:response regulator transcription factor [Magnetospirillum sp. SS-4]|uniref:response regulator transcription factor n=1 Tax=Magnetospirillum sp. SS-4 TaxID=2681465 RepID=UPI00137DFB8F|nr:response regulator transcription factor [Magnetospirillum sp. SS-4]CAA7621197.1 Response regulator [Magnetospirillum sp. SS-4]
MGGSSRILLIIADPMLRQTVAEHLGGPAGLAVTEAGSVAEVPATAIGHDVVVIDQDGLAPDSCRILREAGVAAPLLLLCGPGGAPPGCVADAVLAKPLRLGGLAARVAELLARRPAPAGLRLGPWLFQAERRLLSRAGGGGVRLTGKEAAILDRLGRANGQVVPREILLEEVWGYSAAIATHTLETHIYRLRRKIESEPAAAGLLVTESGGYRLALL